MFDSFCWSGLTAILQPQQLQNKVHFRLFFLHGAFGSTVFHWLCFNFWAWSCSHSFRVGTQLISTTRFFFPNFLLQLKELCLTCILAQFNKMVLVFFTSPAVVAGFIAMFLDLTLARKHANTRRDSGRHWWAKFKYFDKDPRSEEFYSLPYGLSKYFPSY